MRNPILLSIAAIVLNGCVAAEYHATGPSSFSTIAANQSCVHAFDPVNRAYGAGVSPFTGVIGALAIAADETSSPEYAAAQQAYDACMLGFGYARN